jgi:hypothetical protein
VFDALVKAYQVRLYRTEAERTQALADLTATSIAEGERRVLVMADTREQVTSLNGAIRDRLVAAGYIDDRRGVVTGAGERLGVGDRVMTRRNDRDLAVANRDTWTITAIDPDGTMTVRGDGRAGSRTLPSAYVLDQVELAYATTLYGAQGETTATGHLLLGEHTTSAGAYVGMTRGRDNNVAHLVADDPDQARKLWNDAFGRDRAALGPADAARRAAADVERYTPHRPLAAALADLRAAWEVEQDLRAAIARTTSRRDAVAAYGDLGFDRVPEINADLAELKGVLRAAPNRFGPASESPRSARFRPAGSHRSTPTGSARGNWTDRRPGKPPVLDSRCTVPHRRRNRTTCGPRTRGAGSGDEHLPQTNSTSAPPPPRSTTSSLGRR